MRTYHEIQTGEVYIEATIKVKVAMRTTLHDSDADVYLDEALYSGEFTIIDEPVINAFEITDIETDIDEME